MPSVQRVLGRTSARAASGARASSKAGIQYLIFIESPRRIESGWGQIFLKAQRKGCASTVQQDSWYAGSRWAFWTAVARHRFLSFFLLSLFLTLTEAEMPKKESGVEPPHSI